MSAQVPQILSRTVVLFVVISLALATARPNHFGDSSQLVNQVVPDSDSSPNNLLDSGLKPWQLEMLAQRLSEINGQSGVPGGAAGAADFTWERGIRSPENKRQSRYRQCYFNPISCFKK